LGQIARPNAQYIIIFVDMSVAAFAIPKTSPLIRNRSAHTVSVRCIVTTEGRFDAFGQPDDMTG
jgi:hypothetical protein